MRSARHVLAALTCGVLLSLLRQPLGGDVLGAVAADPVRAAWLRGLALAAACWLALPLFGGRRRWACSACVAVGFAAHALWLQAWWWPSTFAGFALSAAPLAALAAWLGRAERRAEPDAAANAVEEDAARSPASFATVVGLAAAAAGAAFALEVLARHTRLLGLGTSADDSWQACVLLVLVALGALAFGALCCGDARATPRRARAGLALGLAAAAALVVVSYAFLARFEQAAALADALDRYGLDFSWIGSAHAHLVLASPAFVAPAFALGAALAGARDRRAAGALALGALVGSIAVPFAYASSQRALGLADAHASAGGARWIAIGCAVAGAGAALVALESLLRGERRGWLVLAVAVASAAWPWTRAQRALLLLSPWQRAPAEPVLVIDAPAGLLTVEPLPDGTLAAFHDRVRTTPDAADEGADRRRLLDSLDALGRPAREVRLLFVGQLTPARQHELDALGLAAWRWTSPLGAAARELSAALQGGFESAPERWLEPRAARAALDGSAASEFAPDLALAMPALGTTLSSLVGGRARRFAPPAPRAIADPGGRVAIAIWRDAGSDIAPRALESELMSSFGGPEEWSVATWIGAPPPALASAGGDARLDAGSGGGARAAWRRVDGIQRMEPGRARAHLAAQTLAHASAPARDFARALFDLYSAQVESPQWESEELQLELDTRVLESLARAAGDGLAPAERELWSALARVLTVKREPDLALKFFEPLAQAHAPWPELERAVAHAYLEFDMPAEALAALERMADAAPYDLALRIDAAGAARMLGDHAREVRWLRAAAAIQPGRADIERLLGVALVRLGDPDGKRLVREALLRDPDDAELEPFLGPGPYPAPERGYAPHTAHEHDEAH
ncbi:MAG: hypothetical protein EPO68_12175 [Planctomycetota bacterium]|nr:MAG: hypothetical protein EPO68_12175 [Planctomycetota bacterium]